MRTLALRVLIGSIALSALTGIYVILAGSDGDLEGKILITALSISVVSILVMACGAALERRKLGLLPHAGTVSAIGAFSLIMIVIWEFGSDRAWVQWGLTLALTSAAAALACLLSLAVLASRFRWVRVLGLFSDAALAAMLIQFVWELLDTEGEILARMTGVLAILLGSVTVAVPILQRMSRPEESSRERTGAHGRESVRHCVVCGQALNEAPATEINCPECGARFRIEFSTEC